MLLKPFLLSASLLALTPLAAQSAAPAKAEQKADEKDPDAIMIIEKEVDSQHPKNSPDLLVFTSSYSTREWKRFAPALHVLQDLTCK